MKKYQHWAIGEIVCILVGILIAVGGIVFLPPIMGWGWHVVAAICAGGTVARILLWWYHRGTTLDDKYNHARDDE